ncbi:hypothetical protein BHE74_00034754, partial [Ensete ventricosum]
MRLEGRSGCRCCNNNDGGKGGDDDMKARESGNGCVCVSSSGDDAAYEERGSEQDEREVGYSPRGEEASSRAPTEKKGHKERLTMAETRLDVLEASVEELYQGQGRLLGVESSQEEAETRIEKVESLIDQLIEDTKDFVRHLHEVVTELTAKVMVLTRTLDAGGNNTHAVPPQHFRAPESQCYGGARDAKELENFLFDIEQYFRTTRLDSEETK